MNCRLSSLMPKVRHLAVVIALASTVSLGFAVSAAMAAPVIDGNLTDLIAFGNSLVGTKTGYGATFFDPDSETKYNDLKFIPCEQPQPLLNTHWQNGVEIINHYLAYERGTTDLYLGLTSPGIIGDADGNLNPDNLGGGGCNPSDNIEDFFGIGGTELYAWQFDLNCDGVNDASIQVQDNKIVGGGLFAGASGEVAFRAAGIADGHSLELHVILPAPLPPAFKFTRVESNMFDGLGEDRSNGGLFQPVPDINVIKSATPVDICAGGKTRFTFTVQNTGTAPLSVVAVDQLPAALSYADNLSNGCGVGEPTIVGQTLTFPTFNLDPGASCSISFDAQASAECFGSVTNVVDVTGTFSSACVENGGISKPAHAEFTVNCKSKPCVELTADREPATACPGTPITVHGTVKNCSLDSENIRVTVNGNEVFNQAVAAGDTQNYSTTINMPECTSGEAVPFNVAATATGDCEPADTKTANLTVGCVTPEVEILKSVSPTGAVDQGTVLHYTITVTNPSKTVALENVVVRDPLCSEVTFQGNATPAPDAGGPAIGQNGTLVWTIGTLAAGGSVTITFDAQVRTLSAPECEATNRSCTNTASVDGNCASKTVHEESSVTTDINPCIAQGLCRLTGGGCMNDNPDTGNKGHKQSTFGGNASPEHSGGGPTGNEWEHVYRDGRTILFNWHSHDAHVIACSVVGVGPCSPHATNTKADFVGTGLYSLGAGSREADGNMVAYIIDHKEGSCNKGTRDEYCITVRTGLVIGEGTIVFSACGFIDCGNLQIHETPASILGGAGSVALPSNEVGSTGVALLNRAYPNPFSGSTTFAYKVADGGAQVEVGVYNVAGRMVKSLAAGSQPAGIYSVTWDGSDASGVRMAPGVYFLKSKVGGEQVINRLIYVSK